MDVEASKEIIGVAGRNRAIHQKTVGGSVFFYMKIVAEQVAIFFYLVCDAKDGAAGNDLILSCSLQFIFCIRIWVSFVLSGPPFPVEAPVLDGFGYMLGLNVTGGFQVGNRSAHL